MTTVAIMARAPVPGRCKTRLGKELGYDEAATLYEAMLRDRIAAVGALEGARPVVLVAPEDDGVAVLSSMVPSGFLVWPQEGGDLGERLAHGFRGLFATAKEGELVCIVDSDSPVAPLTKAVKEAQTSTADVILGTCDDGGYYLVGMRRLHEAALVGIPWSTPEVTQATHARGRSEGFRVAEIAPSWDVDTRADVKRLAALGPALDAPLTRAWLARHGAALP